MTSTTWVGYLPIRRTLIVTTKSSDEVERAIEELISLSGTLSFCADGLAIPIALDVAGPPDFYAEYSKVPLDHVLRRHFLMLRATATVDRPLVELVLRSEGQSDFTVDERVDGAKIAGAHCLRDALFEIVLAANLARPGVLMPEGGAIFCEGSHCVDVPRFLNPIDHAIAETTKISWPPLRTLELKTVWDWLIRVPGFREGIAKTDLGRALAAFSYLFTDSIDGDLPFGHGLWAIMGLEAIYGEGTEQVTRQLVDRTNAFLGQQTTHKKALKEMYSFRSRFLHGDTDFPYAHCRLHGTDAIERFYQSAIPPEALAVRVLTATLQQMVIQNRMELSFRTEVEPARLDDNPMT